MCLITIIRSIIKKYFKILLSVVLVASLGFAITFGFSCGYLSTETTIYDYLEEYSYPDAYISTKILYKDESEKLLAIDGINGCDTRLYGDTIMQTGEGNFFTSRIFCYTEAERQKFYIWSSVDTPGQNGVYIEYSFAENNHIKPGDKVYFRIRGKYRQYTVKGIVTRPETLSTGVTDQSWGINYDFGFVYAPDGFLKEEYKRDYDEEKQKLDEKARELTEEKEKKQKELNDAKTKLNEVSEELEKKKKEYADGKKEAMTTKAELKKKREEAEVSVKQLETQKKQLSDAIKDIESGKTTLEEERKKLEAGNKKLAEAKEGIAKIDEGLELLKMKKEGLERNEVKMLIQLYSTADSNVTAVSIKESLEMLYGLVTKAKDYGFSYSETQDVPDFVNQLKKYVNVAKVDYAYLMSLRVQQLLNDNTDQDTLNNPVNQYAVTNILKRYKGRDYTGNEDIFEDLTDIYGSLAELDYAVKEPKYLLAVSLLEKLDDSYTVKDVMEAVTGYGIIEEYFSDEIPLGGISAGSTIVQYKTALSKTTDDMNTLISRRSEIIAEIEKSGFDIDDIDKAFTQLEEQEKNGLTTLEALRNNQKKLEDGLTQLRNGINDAKMAEKEIDDKLAEASSKLADAESEYNGKLNEYQDALHQFNLEITDAKQKLSDAYKELENNKSYDEQCNQFLLYFDKDADTSELMEQAMEVLGKDNIISNYIRSNSPVEKRIDASLKPTHTMMYFVPIVFYAVILVVIFLFMSMLIRLNRREIGILRAMGFTKGYIKGMFCLIGLIMSVLAILLGAFGGIFILIWVSRFFVGYFSIHYVINCFDIRVITIAVVSTAAVCVLATLISAGYVSKISPKEAMSRTSRPSPQIPHIMQLILSKTAPITKFSILSLLRSKGRSVFSVICIAASIMLIYSSFSFISSKNYTIDQTFFERMNYDCQIFVEDDKQDELMDELKGIDYITAIEKSVYFETEVSFKDKSERITINAIAPDMNMVGIYGSDRQKLNVREGEIILERHLAENLDIHPGDKVTIEGAEFIFTQMSDQCANRIQYIALSDAKKINHDHLVCLFCNMKDDKKQSLLSFLNDYEGYMYSVFTKNVYDSMIFLNRNFDLAAWVLVAFSMLIGFIVVVNTTLTNIQDLKKELCILRTLGFQHSEISQSRLNRLPLQLVCAGIPGILGGMFLSKYAFMLMSRPEEEFVFVSGITEILITIVPVLIYLLAAHFLTMNSMKKWNIAEIVKDKE